MTHHADVGFAWSGRREGEVGGERSELRRGRQSIAKFRSTDMGRVAHLAAYSALGVWFPPSKLNTLSAAPELVEHHPGRARVHRVVPKEPAYGIGRAIYVVDKIINPNLIAILGPIFGHALISPRKIE